MTIRSWNVYIMKSCKASAPRTMFFSGLLGHGMFLLWKVAKGLQQETCFWDHVGNL